MSGNETKNSTISVLIFTYNSDSEIAECIKTAQRLSSKTIVIDLSSKDETIKIAKELNAVVYEHPFTSYVETVRDFGVSKVNSDWIFILDADERITPELASEIKQTLENTKYTHFKVPRKEFFAKKVWLMHGGWWPNLTSGRLFKKSSFKKWPTAIHSSPIIDGEQSVLNNPLLHYSKNDYSEIVLKTIKFENIESDLLLKANKSVSIVTFFRKFAGELYRRMFKNKGYKDGTIGIIESIYQAFSKTITYLYLYEKKNNRSI